MQSFFQNNKAQLHAAIFHEQILLLYSQTPLISLANIPAALITVYVLFNTVPDALLLSWAGVLSIYSIIRIYPTRLFHNKGTHRLKTWKWTSIISVFLMGLLWGSLAAFFDYGLNQFQEYYIVLLLLGLSSIAIAANHAYLPTFFAFIFPALLPLAIVFLSSKSVENTGLGMLLLFYIAILISAAISAVKNTKKTIQLRMQNSQLVEELSSSNQELFNEIDERKHIQQQLEKSRQEAVLANQAKSEFLSRMSHELRTPMNAVLGFSELLLDDEVLGEQQKDDIKRIKNAGEHLLSLINEILDISRIEAGRMNVSMEPVAISELVHECVQLVYEQAKKMEIELHVQSLQLYDDIFVHADQMRLKQVLLNLISNAIKYNRLGGKVWIEWESIDNDAVNISIRDNGIGVPAKMQSQIFQPFNRLGAEHTNIEGTGIGLVITKRLVELMDGTIGFSSNKKDGTRFWLSLQKTENKYDSADADIDELHKLYQDPLTKFSLLYIEDNKNNLELIRQFLQKISAAVLLHAPSAELGLEIARGNQPDIILMDINLPGMDGYEALHNLRSYPETAGIPVIAISANAMPSDLIRGQKAGFHEYVSKPVNFQHLAQALQSALKRH
ncbi:MAG: ATP-binding protein [Gammaproteobacteria bacterium]|nr:ATP-binding protein [Gammaproteobacteria bacterium]